MEIVLTRSSQSTSVMTIPVVFHSMVNATMAIQDLITASVIGGPIVQIVATHMSANAFLNVCITGIARCRHKGVEKCACQIRVNTAETVLVISGAIQALIVMIVVPRTNENAPLSVCITDIASTLLLFALTTFCF